MKILISWHRIPDVEVHTTIRIKNIVEELKKSTNVEIIWLICMPEPLIDIPNFGKDVKILDIHNYENAIDVLKKEKPDLIFGSSSYNLISYSLAVAGKFLNIPILSDFSQKRSSDKLSASNIKLFFEKSVSTDDQTTKKFMRRGRFLVYKFLFVLKTQIARKMNPFLIIKFCFILFKHHLFYEELPMDVRFANDIHWVSDESLFSDLIQHGFDPKTLFVTGDPYFDQDFKKINLSTRKKLNGKIRVLFAPSTNYEHGLCSKSEQNNAILSILRSLSKNKKFELIFKIHPSSANLSDYEKLVASIDPDIKIYQTGNIIDYIETTDIIIVFPAGFISINALIAKIPIIIFNFYNDKNDIFLEKNLAFECHSESELPNLIELSIKKPISEDKINNFLSSFYYKTDGLSSKRVATVILNFLKIS